MQHASLYLRLTLMVPGPNPQARHEAAPDVNLLATVASHTYCVAAQNPVAALLSRLQPAHLLQHSKCPSMGARCAAGNTRTHVLAHTAQHNVPDQYSARQYLMQYAADTGRELRSSSSKPNHT